MESLREYGERGKGSQKHPRRGNKGLRYRNIVEEKGNTGKQ